MRALQVYRNGGLPAIARVAERRYRQYRSNFTTSWVRIRAIRELVHKRIEPIFPPILVLSLPRSGSSWVGITLGSATDAMYLREPVTTTNMLAGGVAVFPFDSSNPPEPYLNAAENAFRGIPAFNRGVVTNPEQWSLMQRARRRLVIKEVNPYACGWYTNHYKPRVIFVIRHPAGVAQSFRRLNWWPDTSEERFFVRQGQFQGEALSVALESLAKYPNHRVVHYEDLCEKPTEVFHSLFDFTDLAWDSQTQEFIDRSSSGGSREPHWTTNRDSRRMIDAWRSEVSEEELKDLRSSFAEFDLPFYQAPHNW